MVFRLLSWPSSSARDGLVLKGVVRRNPRDHVLPRKLWTPVLAVPVEQSIVSPNRAMTLRDEGKPLAGISLLA